MIALSAKIPSGTNRQNLTTSFCADMP